jgi:hypothetical protein
VSRGKWASEARGSKGARACGGGRRTRGRGRVHGGDVGGRLGTTDGWGPRDRERERESECSRRETTPTGLIHRAAGGRDVRERAGGRSGARIGPAWAN